MPIALNGKAPSASPPHSSAARDGNGDDASTLSEADGDNGLEKEYVFKLIVIGAFNVGKTTFIKRLLETKLTDKDADTPSPSTGRRTGDGPRGRAAAAKGQRADGPDAIPVSPTIGTDFYSAFVPHVVPGANVRLQLWDTAGLARYEAVNETTYRGSSLVLCLFDVTDVGSLEEVTERHLAQAAEFIPDLEQDGIFVIANKLDLLGPTMKEERARNRQRAAKPDAAFLDSGNDDETTDLSSSVVGDSTTGAGASARKAADDDAVITQKDVQEVVLDLFAEVHYAEVSARCRTGMAALLRRICLALLQNEGVLSAEEGAAADELSIDLAGGSKLDKAPGKAPAPAKKPTLTTARLASPKEKMEDSLPSSGGPPAVPSTETNRTSNMSNSHATTTHDVPPSATTAAAAEPAGAVSGGGSWRSSGFNFDLGGGGHSAPPPDVLDGTVTFSPRSALPTPQEGSTTAEEHADPSVRPPAAAEGSEAADTATSPSPAAGRRPKAPVRAPRGRKAPPPPANETREDRLAREKAEMSSLLGRKADARSPADHTTDAASGADEDRFRQNDLDAAEDRAGSADAQSGGAARRGGVPFRSVLDDAAEERDRKEQEAAGRGGGGDAGDAGSSDDDGTALQQAITSRYEDIARSREQARQDAETEARRDKKYGRTPKEPPAADKTTRNVSEMYKKEKVKCKCVVM